ncbi:MAG: hypothetical protein QOK01_136 [Alphaproteobacteria bacterium]|jgi:hypothetical protein|nr:hypothetical protein [Alphaproteobacteria bacterium]
MAKKSTKLLTWRITLNRKRGEYLGTVEAADVKVTLRLAARR